MGNKMIKFDVPEGFKAVVEEKDGEISISFEKEKDADKWEPKDGEFVAFLGRWIGIFKRYSNMGHECYAAVSREGKIYYEGDEWTNNNLRPATTEEIKYMVYILNINGKRWNEEMKQIEDLPRWRAENDEVYYCVSPAGEVIEEIEALTVIDTRRYEAGNYFKTYAAAEKVAKQIRDIFRKSKTE